MTDLSAAENIGRVLAQRCQESGLTSMVLYTEENSEKSDKVFMLLYLLSISVLFMYLFLGRKFIHSFMQKCI